MTDECREITDRVWQMAPNDTRRQRTILLKWSGNLRANDPGLAEELLKHLPVWSPKPAFSIRELERADDEAPLTFERVHGRRCA